MHRPHKNNLPHTFVYRKTYKCKIILKYAKYVLNNNSVHHIYGTAQSIWIVGWIYKLKERTSKDA